MKKKIYISGRITGESLEEAKERFAIIAKHIEKQGDIAVNPFDNGLSQSEDRSCHIEVDLGLLLGCDEVWFLPDYSASEGAMLEYAVAQNTNKKMLMLIPADVNTLLKANGVTKQYVPMVNVKTPFEVIAEEMCELQKRKNADYGNSFDKSLDEFGIVAALVRMGDKMNRLKTLAKNPMKQKVNDESVKDTLIDLAAYALMTVAWM